MEPQEEDGDVGRETSPAFGLERERIRPEVIAMMMDIVERLKENGGCVGALSDLFDVNELWSSNSDFLTQKVIQPGKGAEQAKVAHRRQRQAVRDLLKLPRDAASAFVEIGNHIFSQVRKLEERLGVEENADRLTLLSLPDEILAIIFRNAVDGTRLDEEDSIYLPLAHVQASASLSHVCQRFRHVAISIPYLWNCTFNRMSTDLVEMCFSRLSIPIAEVSVTTTSNLASIESSKSYLSTVVPFSQRWRRYEHEQLRFAIDRLKEVASFSRNLNAPHLLELSIVYSTAPLKLTNGERSQADREAIHYYSTWSCPMLTSVSTRNLIPVPYMIPNSPSLKELDMSMNFERNTPKFSLGDLVSFLSSLVQLEDLTLQFFSLNSNIEEMDSPISTKVALSSLRKLCINLYRCDAEYVDAIFTSIRFPNIVSLKLCVWRLED
ncbi:hypothetical protein SCHPADRAFT_332503 [Schizopora paradoxa]|uniref:Uncharacterized protein n=1 Tax=Schizopora paradoxa TaxID=27342 RepID=A0A0H2SB11_9AGAM|nr:hypothetical protein SCHPADRAFT_332503 [Schizopora paradoxa]